MDRATRGSFKKLRTNLTLSGNCRAFTDVKNTDSFFCPDIGSLRYVRASEAT